MAPRIVLATAGSLGDLHPFIALALALRSRGFQAEIAAAPDYATKVQAEGLVFHPIGPSFAELQTTMGMTEAELTRAVARSNTFLFEKLLLPHLENGARALAQAATGAAVIVGSTFAAGAAMAAETLGIPFVPVALQPTVLMSVYDPPVLPGAPWMAAADGGFQLSLNRMTVAAARSRGSRWTVEVDRVRTRLGLPAKKASLLLDGLKGHPLSIGLYSPLLGTAPPDAPSTFVITGYAAYDSEAGGPAVMPPQLLAFLGAGPAPIVFTLGSAAVNIPGRFYVESLKAVRLLDRRAVLLVGPGGDTSLADGTDVIALPYAPFSQLFPHAAAIVHQGGVGTTQQALRAGRPQLVVPHLGDQFDNAARVTRLGCGATLSLRRYQAKRIAPILDSLVSEGETNATTARLGEMASQEDGAAIAADRITALLD